MKHMTPKRLFLTGAILFIVFFLLIGVSSVMGEKAVGDRIVTHQCRLQQVEKSANRVKRKNGYRTVYHFSATVEINGQQIRLTPSNATAFYQKYSEGDIAPVYELDGRYTFNRTELIVPGPIRILGTLLFSFSLMSIIGGVVQSILRRKAVVSSQEV